MRKSIYLDYASSTPIDTEVLEAMTPYLKEEYGNPSSLHTFGQDARAAIERAREQVEQFLQCKADEIIFTSGATEANNLAVKGIIKSEIGSTKSEKNSKLKIQNSRPHIVTTAIEHESILEPCRSLEKEGLAEITYVKPQKDGIVLPQDIEKAIQPNTVLVSVMYANSEIGTTQPIEEIGKMLKKYPSTRAKLGTGRSKILFHTDAVQAANFLDCNVEKLGVDSLTLSGHKIYGPKGVGILYKKAQTQLIPFIEGGGQEMGVRSGTENVASIVGMGKAAEQLSNKERQKENKNIEQLRDAFVAQVLSRIPGATLTGSKKNRLPNNAHFRFEGIKGYDLVVLLDQKGVAVSAGSACSEKTQEPSHVLGALGFNEKDSDCAVRFTLGKHTKEKELKETVSFLTESVVQLQKNRV